MKRNRKIGVDTCWSYAVIVLSILMLGALSAMGAQMMISQPSLSGSTAVVVNKLDGTTVRGTLNQCTPELLYVTPVPRPGLRSVAEPPPATQPSEIPWKQIRTVSNGLSPRVAMEIWMAQNASHLCPTCHGERTVWCPVCKGTRHDPASATTCPTCKGELLVDCKTMGEKKGQIACPNSCLKLGVGNWQKKPDGLMWRTWTFPHGQEYFSERHIGDVMFTDPKSTPPISDQGKCPVCGGTTTVNDPRCFGTGSVPCPTCLARSSAASCRNQCDNGRVVCPTCGGTGLQKS